MDSPVFTYSAGWQVTASGADPAEPESPWEEPAGTLEFNFVGQQLDLLLAVGDYWSYIYVTVDGQPANRLASIPGNSNSRQLIAGYRTLYAPELRSDGSPTPQWITVHDADSASEPHSVMIEIWRGWGQVPLRAVAIDVRADATLPSWPGLLLLLLGIFGVVLLEDHAHSLMRPITSQSAQNLPLAHATSGGRRLSGNSIVARSTQLANRLRVLWPAWIVSHAIVWTILATTIILCGVLWNNWWLTCLGLATLTYLAVMRPSLWMAVFLFGLPSYYSVNLPILPGRAFGLVDIGGIGGICVLLANRVLVPSNAQARPAANTQPKLVYVSQWLSWSLAVLCAWALVSATAANYPELALHEWRTVFLSAFLFSLLLRFTLSNGQSTHEVYADDLWLLVTAWQIGATSIALIGLWHYVSGSMLITAEGVSRIRALYGSPNNLALYLDRSIAVALGLALFLPRTIRVRRVWLVLALVQILGLLLTFSKGSILLGLPAIFAILALSGFYIMRGRAVAKQALLVMGIFMLMIMIVIFPFLGTERFRIFLDLSQGTGYLRIQLWRSSLQMALDHPWLGVGPDNFLYVFRSIYLLPGAWQEPDLNHPHNVILDWWTRLGLPGLLFAIYFFTRGVVSLLRAISDNTTGTPALTALYIGMLAAAAGALAHGLIDASYALPDLMITWVLLFGLVVTARSAQFPRQA